MEKGLSWFVELKILPDNLFQWPDFIFKVFMESLLFKFEETG